MTVQSLHAHISFFHNMNKICSNIPALIYHASKPLLPIPKWESVR
jgi:hypothetical protein